MEGREIEFLAESVKRRVGDRVPSMWRWCSHLGRAARRGWSGERHIVEEWARRSGERGGVRESREAEELLAVKVR